MTMTTREPISIENGRVEIHTPENRVWLTRHQIADLFGVFVPAVGSNIRSILKAAYSVRRGFTAGSATVTAVLSSCIRSK